jgi:hypothetical protein
MIATWPSSSVLLSKLINFLTEHILHRRVKCFYWVERKVFAFSKRWHFFEALSYMWRKVDILWQCSSKETMVQTRGGTKPYSKEKSTLQKINDLCLVGYGKELYELLRPNKTINSEVYCQQLDRVNECLKGKRPQKRSCLSPGQRPSPCQ